MTQNATKRARKNVENVRKITKKGENVVKNEEKSPKIDEFSPNLMSISALSRKFKLDRATVAARIAENEIEPYSNKANEKLYILEDVEFILRQDEYEKEKLRKTRAEAEIKEHDLAIKKGEYGSVQEFTEVTQKIFSRLYKKLAVQLPARIAKRLHDANSAAELQDLLRNEIAKEFDSLRSDFTKYL